MPNSQFSRMLAWSPLQGAIGPAEVLRTQWIPDTQIGMRWQDLELSAIDRGEKSMA